MNERSRGQRWVLAAICGVLPAALLAAGVAVPAAAWPRLPGRIADHWTFTGTVDGAAPRLVPFLILGGLALIGVAMLRSGLARRSPAKTGAITTGLFVIAVATASSIMVTVANVSVSSWREASVGLSGLCGLVGAPAVLTAAASYLLRRRGAAQRPDRGGRLPQPCSSHFGQLRRVPRGMKWRHSLFAGNVGDEGLVPI
jgi:hypothetical protein